MSKRSIPTIRVHLEQTALELRRQATNLRLEADAIDVKATDMELMAKEMKRTTGVAPRAPITSQAMTPELADEVRVFKRSNPAWSHAEIGAHFNVNPGRVSDALHRRV